MLRQQIQKDMIDALKAQNKERLVVLRGVLSDIKNVEIDKKSELTDEEVVGIIKRQLKKLAESRALFEKGGRADLVTATEKEEAILKEYAPAELSDEALESAILAILAEYPHEENVGKLIGLCVGKLKDKADSSRIAEAVKKIKTGTLT